MTEKKTLIGISGVPSAGSGKDTVARLIQKHSKHYYLQKTFSWPVRLALQTLTNCVVNAHDTISSEGKSRKIPEDAFGRNLTEFRRRMTSTFSFTNRQDLLTNELEIKHMASILCNSTWSVELSPFAIFHLFGTGAFLRMILPFFYGGVLWAPIVFFCLLLTLLECFKISKSNISVKSGMTVGRALQLIGTDIGRKKFGLDVWCSALKKDLLQDTTNNIVNTDSRFENEYFMLHESLKDHYNTLPIKVDASKRLKNRNDTMKDGRSATHESEHPLPAHCTHIVIDNNSTLENLEENVIQLIRQYNL